MNTNYIWFTIIYVHSAPVVSLGIHESLREIGNEWSDYILLIRYVYLKHIEQAYNFFMD